MNETVLVRYGSIPEVARFDVAVTEPIQREEAVVVRSHRGVEVETLLEPVGGNTNAAGSASLHSDEKPVILRRATPQDHDRAEQLRSECQRHFDEWRRRICDWDLDLVNLERTLERTKLILYVLNNRGPDWRCSQRRPVWESLKSNRSVTTGSSVWSLRRGMLHGRLPGQWMSRLIPTVDEFQDHQLARNATN